MNQILSVEMPKKGQKQHKTSVHSILIVFAVITIIFGIGLTSSGVYVCYKNISSGSSGTEVAATDTKPTITTERESSNVIYIVVEHDKEIASLSYTINGEELQIDIEEGQTSLKEKVTLPSGEILLTITAKDINGVAGSYSSNLTVEQAPVITLEQVGTQIKVTIESELSIDYVTYYWDDDEEGGQTYEINDTKTETLVDVPEGEHTLNVKAVDKEGNEATTFQKIKGNVKPTIKVTTNGKVFYITITDDEALAKVGVRLEVDGEIVSQEVENVSGTMYEVKLNVEDGDNKLTIVAYDNYGVSNAIIRNFNPNDEEDMASVDLTAGEDDEDDTTNSEANTSSNDENTESDD